MTHQQTLEINEYRFDVAEDLDYYGPEATEADVEDYAEFAEEYLTQLAGQDVEIDRVQNYSFHESQDVRQLREHVWQKFLNQ